MASLENGFGVKSGIKHFWMGFIFLICHKDWLFNTYETFTFRLKGVFLYKTQISENWNRASKIQLFRY